MGRRPDPYVSELKAALRGYLDEALLSEYGIVLSADTSSYVLNLLKQVKREQPRWADLIVRPGTELFEIWLIKKEALDGAQET